MALLSITATVVLYVWRNRSPLVVRFTTTHVPNLVVGDVVTGVISIQNRSDTTQWIHEPIIAGRFHMGMSLDLLAPEGVEAALGNELKFNNGAAAIPAHARVLLYVRHRAVKKSNCMELWYVLPWFGGRRFVSKPFDMTIVQKRADENTP